MEQVLKVRWTIIASNEFEETVVWLILHWNEEIAHSFITQVLNKINRLCCFLQVGS